MKKLFFTLIILVTSAFAHAQTVKAQSAVEYNNFFIDSQQTLTDYVNKLNRDIELYGDDSIEVNMAVLQSISKELLSQAVRIETYEHGEYLKAAFIALFDYYNNAFANEFPELFGIYTKADATQSDNARADQLLEQLTTMESKLEKECRSAQDEFAAFHGFVIEEPVK